MDSQFLRFYELFGVLVVLWLYGLCSLFTAAGSSYRVLEFQDRFDILLEKRPSGVAELRYRKLYGLGMSIQFFEILIFLCYMALVTSLVVLGTGWSTSVFADCELAKLLASDGARGDRFGVSIDISGDTAVIGAPYDNDTGASSGSAYIFRFNGSSWVEEAKLHASDGAAGDDFGVSVGISGDIAVIGAKDDDDNGTNSGSAYIFGLSLNPGDLDFDNDVDFYDFSLFAAYWLETDCGPCRRCDRADFTSNGQVDYYDLKELCDNWLAGK